MAASIRTPQSSDPNAWERYYSALVTRAVLDGELPSKAGPPIAEQVRSEWALQFPTETFPLKFLSPASRSAIDVQGISDQTREEGKGAWVVIARPEDDRSLFPEDERVTPTELRDMAAVYDPEFRVASVVMPNGGPAHFTGEWDQWIPGTVRALSFDSYNLWALVRDSGGSIAWMVQNEKILNRSLRYWPQLPELEGSPPYLRHLALLTGEPPGIPNMPPMTEFFPRAEAQMASSEVIKSELEQLPTRSRSMVDLPETTRSLTMSDEKKKAAPAGLDGKPDTSNEQSVDLEEFSKVLIAQVSEVVDEKLKALQPKPKADDQDPPTIGEQIKSAMSDVLEPMRAELKQLKDDAAQSAKASRNARIRSSLDDLVRQGRLSPFDRKLHEDLLLSDAISDEMVQKTLDELGKRPVQLHRTAAQLTDPDSGNVVNLPAELTAPPGVGAGDPTDARIVLAAAAKAREAKSEDERFRIFKEELLSNYGENGSSELFPSLN